MPPTQIINVHTHLHKSQDVDARVKLWRECGLVKVCVQVLTADPADSTYDNAGVLEWMRKYPDILLGFGYVELGPRPDPPEQVDRLKEHGFTGLKFIAPSEPYDQESQTRTSCPQILTDSPIAPKPQPNKKGNPERESMVSTDSHRLTQMGRKKGSGVKPKRHRAGMAPFLSSPHWVVLRSALLSVRICGNLWT